MNKEINNALEILELGPEATPKDIEQAYRDLAMVWHPDRFQDNSRLRSNAEKKLKKINRAHEDLQGYQLQPKTRSTSDGSRSAKPRHTEENKKPQKPRHTNDSASHDFSRKKARKRKTTERREKWKYTSSPSPYPPHEKTAAIARPISQRVRYRRR